MVLIYIYLSAHIIKLRRVNPVKNSTSFLIEISLKIGDKM